MASESSAISERSATLFSLVNNLCEVLKTSSFSILVTLKFVKYRYQMEQKISKARARFSEL